MLVISVSLDEVDSVPGWQACMSRQRSMCWYCRSNFEKL